MGNRKRILLTGGRGPATLDLARQFSRLGHEVYVAEARRLHFCTFSNAVKKAFVVPSPLEDEGGFVEALINILKTHHVDYLIPTYDEVYFIAKHKKVFEPYAHVFCHELSMLDTLNNKQKFMAWMDALGMNVPATRMVKNKAEYHEWIKACDVPYPHILKPIYTGGGIEVLKIRDALEGIQAEPVFPSLVQEFIEGDNYCTFGIAHQGKISCHTTYRPLYIFRENGAAVCFQAIDDPAILAFVSAILAEAKYTGMLGFDIIKKKDGTLWAIECNPRITNGIHLVEERDQIDTHFFGVQPLHLICPLQPRQVTRAAMLRILGVTVREDFGTWFHYFKHSKEVIFDWRDPLPGCLLPILGLQFSVDYFKHHKKPEQTIFYNHDWSSAELDQVSVILADPDHRSEYPMSSLFCKPIGPRA